jgi:CheY-like chemotaxis protein
MTANALVVDDSKVIQFKLCKMLESRGLGTHVAGSGAEALAFLKDNRPDFVLMDYMMEDLDGYEVTRRIVADPQTTSIPVFICTGEDTPEARARAADTGARGFMVKPVDESALDRLLATLKATRPPEAAPTTARQVMPVAERLSQEGAAALAQAAVRDAVEHALGERMAAAQAEIERTMHGVAERVAAAAIEHTLQAWRAEQARALERFAEEAIAAGDRAVDLKLAPALASLENARISQQAALVQVEKNAIEGAHEAARQAIGAHGADPLRAISAEIEVLKAHHAALEERLGSDSARVAETATTRAHDPAELTAIATDAAERVARDLVNENMRDREAPARPLAEPDTSPADRSRRGSKVLVTWMAGLTVVVLWMLVRGVAG